MMRLILVDNQQELLGQAALYILGKLLAKPDINIGLATGNTFVGVYKEWKNLATTYRIDCHKAQYFQLDEYAGLPSHHRNAMGTYLQKHFLKPLSIPPDRYHLINGANDPQLECSHYETKIKQAGGIQIQLLGIGQNGHIAFNEPDTPFHAAMHVSTLSESTRQANASIIEGNTIPTQALTLGIGNIMESQEIVLLAYGQKKAQAVRDMLQGILSEKCPASILRFHPQLTIFLDQEAASLLKPSTSAGSYSQGLQIHTLHDRILKSPQSVLITAPHPDDAAISCGGTIARLKEEGHDLMIACMSTGHRANIPDTNQKQRIQIRWQEAKKEGRILGAKVTALQLPFYERNYMPSSEDIHKCYQLLTSFQPSVIFSASPQDGHPAHRASALIVQETARQYCQTTGNPLELWFYEGPWFLFERDAFNTVTILDKSHLLLKNRAIQQHQSQVSRKPYHLAAEALGQFRAITTPESRVSVYGNAIQDLGESVEVFRRINIS